ncbi:MAG: ywqJ, partial [Neobacillus sp.]|nr:ywqJ [Neobacillus sp.]
DLARLRKKLMVPERNTVAIGKARIEGIDEVIELSGASPRVRQDAKLPSLDVIAPNRDIKAPTTVAMNKNHAEEEVFYHFDERIKLEGISPNKVKGELYLHQSNKAGVCPTCLQGIKNLNKAPGIFKQFSDKYPNLKVVVTSEGSEGVKAFGRQHFILKAGKYME